MSFLRRLLFALFLVVAALAQAPNASRASPAVATVARPFFITESAAQAHCPKDEVVWLNVPSRIYHEKGMRWYGRNKHGAYVRRKEADEAGDRDTRNGQ